MKLSLSTILGLLVALAGLAAGYASGFLTAHPDITAVLVALEQIVSAFLPKVLGKPDAAL